MTPDEYRRVVLTENDRVYSYAAWLLCNLEDARDVTQEALLRLWEHREPLHPGVTRAWLLRTVHRLCVDQLRRRSCRRERPLGDLESIFADCSNGPMCRAVEREERAVLLRELNRLSARDRAVLVLREIEGLSYVAIGDVLDMPLATVKVALHRSRRRLLGRVLAAAEVL